MARIPVMSVAEEARVIARQLIHEHHQHLVDAQILYVFTDQKRKRCDRVRLGSAAKLSSRQRFLASGMDGVEHGPDFIILIDAREWADLDKKAREALVDHELCHCALFVKDHSEKPAFWRRFRPTEHVSAFEDDDRRWGMRGHDIEEFSDVLYRHGWWKSDPEEQRFKMIAIQLALPKDGAPKREPAGVKET